MRNTISFTRLLVTTLLLTTFSAFALAQPRPLTLEASARQVKCFEKIELTLRCGLPFANPYDPAEADLQAELQTPSGKKILLSAFYCQPVEYKTFREGRRANEWFYPAGDAVWKVRFTPTEPGAYSCVARLSGKAGTAQSPTLKFDALPAQSKGYVRVSRRDPRFLEFDNGSPFFPVGQNVAFIKNLAETEEIFQRLAENGVNYVRVWACCEDWGMAIEARRTVWGRSWGAKPQIVDAPGPPAGAPAEKCVRLSGDKGRTVEASPSRPLGLKPSARYVLTGKALVDSGADLSVELGGPAQSKTLAGSGRWSEIKFEFATQPDQQWMPRLTFRFTDKGSALVGRLSLREAVGGPELLEEADLSLPARGFYHQIDSFILDRVVEAAERNGIYLQLVILPRDNYMNSLKKDDSPEYDEAIALSKRLLRYAVARWGYSTHVAVWEYFNENNPGLPTDKYYGALGDYLAAVDPWRHLRAVSAWGPSEKDWRHPKLDTADLHYYMRPATGELFKDAAASVADRAKFFRQRAPNKPAMFAEFGLADDKFMLSPRVREDREYLFLHNALWASALSGLSSTVMAWWWEDIQQRNVYHHYRPVAAFVADIPYTTAGLQQAAATADKGLRVVGLQGKSGAYLWIQNPQSTWYNLGVEKITLGETAGATLTLDKLEPGAYQVLWWDTWKGAPVARETLTAGGSGLQLKIPSFTRDLACKVVK